MHICSLLCQKLRKYVKLHVPALMDEFYTLYTWGEKVVRNPCQLSNSIIKLILSYSLVWPLEPIIFKN